MFWQEFDAQDRIGEQLDRACLTLQHLHEDVEATMG